MYTNIFSHLWLTMTKKVKSIYVILDRSRKIDCCNIIFRKQIIIQMGVMECNRKGCGEIMCKRYSAIHGYICEDCFSELLNSILDVSVFMDSNKYLDPSELEERKALLEKEFCMHEPMWDYLGPY
jgi:hypothetical protein